MSSLVSIQLPKAGLGNQLFPLLHGYVFARLNQLPVMVTGYHQIKPGPWLRGERVKRQYKGYFRFEKPLLQAWIDEYRISQKISKARVVFEPGLAVLPDDAGSANTIYSFEKLPTYHDYFQKLKPHRALVKDLFRELISEKYITRINELPAPVIGVHIRMGDFRKLKPGEDFKGGHVRTPLSYFVDMIEGIRELAGANWPVSLFSDGHEHELMEVLNLPDITHIRGHADLTDLMLLSRSQVLVTTTGSTFSYWAAFLADAPVLVHPDHIYASFRPDEVNQVYYEGALKRQSPAALLMKNLKQIASTPLTN